MILPFSSDCLAAVYVTYVVKKMTVDFFFAFNRLIIQVVFLSMLSMYNHDSCYILSTPFSQPVSIRCSIYTIYIHKEKKIGGGSAYLKAADPLFLK